MKIRRYLTLKDSFRNCFDIFIVILFPLLFIIIFEPNVISLIIFFFISGITLRQLSEWLHEGIHYNIHSNRKFNDTLSSWLLSSFFFTPLDKIRKAHFSHHSKKYFFTHDDKDTHYAEFNTRKNLLKSVAMDLLGINAFKNYFLLNFSDTQTNKIFYRKIFSSYFKVLLIHLLMILWSILFGKFLFYFIYILSLITFYPFLSRIRLYGQHLYINQKNYAETKNSSVSRTINGSFVERVLFSSKLMQYHYEHHLFPGLTYRNLIYISKNKKYPNNKNIFLDSYKDIFIALWRINEK